MTSLAIYQIDAFSSHCFGGNPAAIVPLDNWLDTKLLQAIASENNLSETAFLVPLADKHFELRWFTPAAEVDLCGHATLASAWYVFNQTACTAEVLRFETRSGQLSASRCGNAIEIDLPARSSMADEDLAAPIAKAIGVTPLEVRRGANAIALLRSQYDIESLQPDMRRVAQLHPLGLLVSAPGDHHDFVSRFFAPSYGIDEDPVTGSAHADLMPIWSEKLGRRELSAKQLSARGGEILCRIEDHRVYLRGHCALYLQGEIFIQDGSAV